MRYLTTVLFFIIFALSLQAQDKAKQLFQKAISKYESGDYFEAANEFKEIFENYKKFDYNDQCFYNTAYSYHQADSLDLAIEWYEKIRASDLKDEERVGGRGIHEPYANYKHNSTFNIATIEYKRENYKKALDYYKQSLKDYPYYNSSGTDLRIKKNRLIINITDCLEKLGRYEEALITIVPESLDSKGSSNYNSVVKRSIEIINEHFDKVKIKNELDSAIENLSKNSEENSYLIRFRNEKLKLFPYGLDYNSVSKFKKEIKASIFWKQLSKK